MRVGKLAFLLKISTCPVKLEAQTASRLELVKIIFSLVGTIMNYFNVY